MIRRNESGFTLFELLIVVAVISTMLAILMPALGRARTIEKRIMCMSNLRKIGIGMNTYSQNFEGKFPVVGLRHQTKRSTFGFTPYNDGTSNANSLIYNMPLYNIPGSYGEASHKHLTYINAGLYLLVRLEGLDPDLFLCPSDTKAQEMSLEVAQSINPAITSWQDMTMFSGRRAMSYSFWDAFNYLASSDEWANRPLAADISPACDTSDFSPGVIEFSWDSTDLSGASGSYSSPSLGPFVPASGISTEEYVSLIVWDNSMSVAGGISDNTRIGHGNSNNHGTEFQNVMFGDGRVATHKTPLAGANGDNIYTQWTSGTISNDPASQLNYRTRGFWRNGGNSFGTAGFRNPNGARDELDSYLGN